MRLALLTALLIGTSPAAWAGPQHRWKARREEAVPAPPAWLRPATMAACPGIVPGGFEAYFAKGGAWLAKVADARTGTPREVLFLSGKRSGRVLGLGEVFYTGKRAQIGQGGARFTLAYRD